MAEARGEVEALREAKTRVAASSPMGLSRFPVTIVRLSAMVGGAGAEAAAFLGEPLYREPNIAALTAIYPTRPLATGPHRGTVEKA